MFFSIKYTDHLRAGTILVESAEETVRLLEDDGDFIHEGTSFVETVYRIVVNADNLWFKADGNEVELQSPGAITLRLESNKKDWNAELIARLIQYFHSPEYLKPLGKFKTLNLYARNIPKLTRNQHKELFLVFEWELMD